MAPAARLPRALAPLSARAIRRQTTRDVQAQIAPLAAQINRSALAGSRNISGVASGLAASLAPYAQQVGGIYAGAEKTQSAVDSQLADRLGTNNIAGDLKARLAVAGGDTSLADSLAAASKGAAGAGFAVGAASRGQLISQGASAQTYASKLPGLAGLAGLQGVEERQAQALKETGDLTAKTPGLIASALANARNLEYQKAVARLGFGVDTAKLNAQTAQDKAANDIKVKANEIRQNAITAANDRSGKTLAERARESNRTLDEQRRKDDQTYRADKAKRTATFRRNRHKDRQPDPALSAKYGHIVDHNGRPILDKHGHKIKTKSGKSGGSASGLGN